MCRSKRWLSMVSMLMMLPVFAGCASKPRPMVNSEKAVEATVEVSAPAYEDMSSGEAYPAPYEVGSPTSIPTAPAGDVYGDEESEGLPRMIVYRGSLDLIVADPMETQDEITALVEGLGGYILSSESYIYRDDMRRVEMTLKVPADRFNEAMSILRKLAVDVRHDTVSTEDVTQEYVDLESRLRALEVKAERLEELMAQAEDTEAVLSVYRELSSTEQEIEQVKGRMRYLERMSAMSTISVTLTPDEAARPVELPGWSPGATVRRAVEALVGIFQFLVDTLIWVLIVIVPTLAVIGLAIFAFIRVTAWLFRLSLRRRPPKSGKQPPTATP